MGEPILRLTEDVVNRIAAGEVLQRPVNAVKELVENSLDAHANQIQVVVGSGGLKSIRVQDNGTGIRRDNLEILCERFTTSKLREYEDLTKMETYGFRGEALASISHVAHLTIQTKTREDKCAYKAIYENGILKGKIKPCAGNQGTIITVEDIFYNVLTRRKALRNPTEEYVKIYHVVGSYAIHNSSIGFILKKSADITDFRTPAKSTAVDNIRIIYGNSVARDLMEISDTNKELHLQINGQISNLNFSSKRGTFLLFINNRLVDSAAIKRALDAIYSTYLPKNSHSFIYLSLEIDPQNVDVNVHPTKYEVVFLYEELIIEQIKKVVETKLLSCSTSRVLYVQSRLPGSSLPDFEIEEKPDKNNDKSINPKYIVRTDSAEQKLEKFFGIPTMINTNNKISSKVDDKLENNLKINNFDEEIPDSQNDAVCSISVVPADVPAEDEITDIQSNVNRKERARSKSPKPYNACINMTSIPNHVTYVNPKDSFQTRKFQDNRIETNLTSIKTLRLAIEENCNKNLRELLANLVFIGFIDESKALIQHSTKMYLCNTVKLMEELFYEILLYDFHNFGFIKFSTPLSIYDLAMIALDLPTTSWSPEDGTKNDYAEHVRDLLISKRSMLLEYFSLDIDNDGNLTSLPMLLDNYTPFMGALPKYILRLVTEVNWNTEKECFKTFCRETAIFYSEQQHTEDEDIVKSQNWTQEHVIYAAIRKYFIPPNEFAKNGVILQIADLPDLYKVFERC